MNKIVQDFLEQLFSNSDLNRLPKSFGGGRIFSNPLIGVARGDDPIFDKYKEIISPKHLTPKEIWKISKLPDIENSKLRILSIICPYTTQIRTESIKAKRFPAEIYSIGRNYANAFKTDVMKQTIKFFQNEGYQATAGMLSEGFNIYRGYYSSWSERHIAFAAGLGTFSLHEGLISEVGCNIRLCSVITNAPLEVTPRKSDDPYTNCLYYSKGTCRECEKKCPAGAISQNGHDKIKCRIYARKIEVEMNKRLGQILKPHWRRIEGELIAQKPPVGCAFCQYGVPCMDKNPMANEK
jgi:epoxyqueuosine reductase QueG